VIAPRVVDFLSQELLSGDTSSMFFQSKEFLFFATRVLVGGPLNIILFQRTFFQRMFDMSGPRPRLFTNWRAEYGPLSSSL